MLANVWQPQVERSPKWNADASAHLERSLACVTTFISSCFQYSPYMAIPTSKPELLRAITERFAKLEAALEAVPPEIADEKSMEGHAKGTMMSANDLVSYLIGWNELVLKWLDQDDKGKVVEFPEVGYKWNELGPLAQKFYGDQSGWRFDENRRKLTIAKDNLVAEISKRTDAELYGSPWHGKWTKGRMIQLNSSSPYENAKGRIRKWLKSKPAS